MEHPLAGYRKRHKKTQADIAEAIGVTRWTIAAIELGLRRPSNRVVKRLVEVTDGEVSADALIIGQAPDFAKSPEATP